MFKRILSAIRLFFTYFRFNLASLMEYRQSFLASAFGMLVSNCTFVFFWKIAFDQIGSRIGGYDFQDMMFIWAAASSSFGLAYTTMGNLGNIGRMIISGDLDVYLLQPRNPLLSMLCAKTDLSAWGDLLYGFILMFFTNNTPVAWLCFIIGIFFGSIIFTATAVISHSLAFFIGDSSFAGSAVSNLVINFTTYPEGIYHKGIRILMYTVLPAAYIVHVPLRMARSGNYLWVLAIAAFTVFFCAAAFCVFKIGLKRYESGNLIGTRM